MYMYVCICEDMHIYLSLCMYKHMNFTCHTFSPAMKRMTQHAFDDAKLLGHGQANGYLRDGGEWDASFYTGVSTNWMVFLVGVLVITALVFRVYFGVPYSKRIPV